MSSTPNTDAPYAYMNRSCTLQWGDGADAYKWLQHDSLTLVQAIKEIMTLEHSDKKDGRSFLQGRLKPTKVRRQAALMDVMEFMAWDIESGETPEEVEARARAIGAHVEIYPTYNSDKGETKIKTDVVRNYVNKQKRWEKLGDDDEASPEQVLACISATKGWQPRVLDSAKYVGRHGHEYIVSHISFPRFRAVRPFTKPLRVEDISTTFTGATKKWAAMYKSAGDEIGIKDFDEKCADLSRLFYPHRRPKGAPDNAIRVLGKGIDPYELRDRTVVVSESTTKSGGDARRRTKHTYENAWLLAELKKCKGKVRVADLVRDYAETHDDRGDKVYTHCPNVHETGVDAVTDLIAVNSADATNDGGGCVFKCTFHNTCNDESGWALLDMFVAEHPEITQEEFRKFIDTTEEDELAEQIKAAIGRIKKTSAVDDVEAILRWMAQRPEGMQDEIDLNTLAKNGPVGKRALRSSLNGYRSANDRDSEDDNGPPPRGQEHTVDEVRGDWDHEDQVRVALAHFQNRNEGDNIGVYRNSENDHVRINLQSKDGAKIESLDHACWTDAVGTRVTYLDRGRTGGCTECRSPATSCTASMVSLT